ncbi:MAG: hypothetical protein AAGH38_10060 [Pseudomonadota bacterium]
MFYVILVIALGAMAAPLLARTWRAYAITLVIVGLLIAVLWVFYFVGYKEKDDGYTALFLVLFSGGVVFTALGRCCGLLLQTRGWSRRGVLWTDALSVVGFGWFFF